VNGFRFVRRPFFVDASQPTRPDFPPSAGADADVALCAALDLPVASDGVPEWIQLTSAGTFSGHDGRGPYRIADAAELAAPQGEAAPARGWIVAL
jgi:hypothetical protein